MKTSIIKLRSKACLIGNTSVLSLMFFILVAVLFCFNLLPEIALQVLPGFNEGVLLFFVSVSVIVLTFCLLSLFGMGFTRFFLRKAQKKGGTVRDLFFYFSPKRAVKLFFFSLRFYTIKALLFIICFSPFILNTASFLFLSKNFLSLKVSVVMLLTGALFLLTGLYFYSLLSSSLFLVKYYYAKGEYLNFRHLIASSQNQMQRHRKALLKLKLSFILWLMLSFLFFPSAYVFSYYSQSKALAALEFMSD